MLHKVVGYFDFTGLSPGRRPIHKCRGCRAHIGGDAPGVAYTIGTTEMISYLVTPLQIAEAIASAKWLPSYPSTPPTRCEMP